MLGRIAVFGRAGSVASTNWGTGLTRCGVRANPTKILKVDSACAMSYLSAGWRSSSLIRQFSKQQAAPELDISVLNDTAKLEEISVKGTLVHRGHEKKVGYWLLLCAGAVFGMIILGGYTRLSKSGLSMVKWKPIEYSYPRSQAQWEEEFDHYKVASNVTRNSRNFNCQQKKLTWRDSRVSS